MQHISSFEIYPVIEINALDFTDKEYDMPNGSRYEYPNEWDARWIKSLADGGIRNVKSLQRGYNIAVLNQIDDHDLEIIIDRRLKGNVSDDEEETEEDTDDENSIYAFNGGVAICAEGIILISPQCCTGIYDYRNWIDALDGDTMEWETIWVGHPWVFGRNNGENLEMTDYMEANTDQITDDKILYSFSRHDLIVKLQEVVVQINEFKAKVGSILKCKNNPDYEKIAGKLVLNEWDEE